jgi:hypothetical protein
MLLDDMLPRSVKEFFIRRSAELMTAGAVDDAHGSSSVNSVGKQTGIASTPLDRRRISSILLIERIGVKTRVSA